MPHQAVVKENKNYTKVWVVYDGLAKINKEFHSLNECLYKGSLLLNDLIAVLLRFCTLSIAIIGDLEKAFF